MNQIGVTKYISKYMETMLRYIKTHTKHNTKTNKTKQSIAPINESKEKTKSKGD